MNNGIGSAVVERDGRSNRALQFGRSALSAFCTLGRREGVSPEIMQRLMRHSDVRTTLEIYSHVTDDGAVRAIEGSMLLPEVTTSEKQTQPVQ